MRSDIVIIYLLFLILFIYNTYILIKFRKIKKYIYILYNILNYKKTRIILKKLKEKPRIRYIVFEVLGNCNINDQQLWRLLRETTREVIGSSGLVLSGISLIYYNNITKKAIIRIRENYKNIIIGILGLIRETNGCNIILVPIRTTGTLKAARKIATSS